MLAGLLVVFSNLLVLVHSLGNLQLITSKHLRCQSTFISQVEAALYNHAGLSSPSETFMTMNS